jgi:lipopolysaccharide heptosyltransferase II
MSPQRILIVNPFGIGDVLFSTPLIRAVRRAFPEAYLAYLCNRRTEQMLRWNQNLNELFIYEKDELLSLWNRQRRLGLRSLIGLLRTIRSRRFELAIDLSLGERYGFVLALLGIPRRIGFDYRRRGRFLTHRFPMDGYHDQHVVEYYERLLAMIGVRVQERQLELATDRQDGRVVDQLLAQLLGDRGPAPLVGIVPAGGISWGQQANYRRWPPEGFVHVGRALSRRYGARVLLFGERNDQPVCRAIAQAIGEAAIDLSGRTTLGQFVQFVSRCAVIIANDGGPIHIAASQGVRTVSLFGPVDPTVYGPYPPSPRHQIVFRADLPCRPCYHRFRLPPCPYERGCLSTLEPAEVLEACERALQDHARAPGLVHA